VLLDRILGKEYVIGDVVCLSAPVNTVDTLHVMGGLVGEGFIDSMMGRGKGYTGTCGCRISDEEAGIGIVLKVLDCGDTIFDS
jgi:hypothetical protein